MTEEGWIPRSLHLSGREKGGKKSTKIVHKRGVIGENGAETHSVALLDVNLLDLAQAVDEFGLFPVGKELVQHAACQRGGVSYL